MTRITDRAQKIAAGTIRQNGWAYAVWADHQVGARVGRSYPPRYWLILTGPDRTIRLSTQRDALYREWMAEIAANGVRGNV